MLIDLPGLLARTHIVSLPLRTRFRGVTHREAALFAGTVTVAGQPVWSEFSPFLEYGVLEASTWLAAALEYGFDPALQRFESGSVLVNATVPAVRAAEVPRVLAPFGNCEVVKVKVAETGQQLCDDLARLEAVRDALPGARMRIDANRGWSLDAATDALVAIEAAGIELEYAEQPVATIAELAQLRERLRELGIATPIAADESVRKANDPLEVARVGAADHVVVKVQPLGGITRAAKVVAQARLTATVSSALETSVGTVMGAQLAARLPEPRFAAGLGTVSLFAADVLEHPRVPESGRISLAPAVPSSALLAAHAAAPDRQRWWRERITRCYEHLVAHQ